MKKGRTMGRGLVVLGLTIGLFASVLASPVLGANCTCTVSATVAQPNIQIIGTSTGTCPLRTRIEVYREGDTHAIRDCTGFTTCSITHNTFTSCLRTGQHTVSANCNCGIRRDLPNGDFVCDEASGTNSMTFVVNTTPTVGISSTQPDEAGIITLTTGYSYPNTSVGDPQRQLKLFGNGGELATSYRSDVSGAWIREQGTACWPQGSNEIKAVATACGGFGDPAFQVQASTSIQVDHTPAIVDLTVEPPAVPGGLHTAKARYAFPQTAFNIQRSLKFREYPSGAGLGTVMPNDREGVAERGAFCPDTPYVEVIASACADAISVRRMAALPGCPLPPRKDGCGKQGGQCCIAGGAGPGGSGPGFGDDSGGGKSLGPGARLHYLAGGVGSPGNPGQTAWNTILGRGWSHDYAERIVTASGGRAWLLTRDGNFREFTDANGDGLYEKVSPEDEYRILTKLTSGWKLRDLDGTAMIFDATGLWQSTSDRNGNTKTATYTAGRLTRVAMPDGRSEKFLYHSSGKLAAIVEVGVDGVTERTWSLTWSGNDLVSIEAPDGTGQRFVYGDSLHPSPLGFMTRRISMGVDDGNSATPRPERVEAAWEYDGVGNVVKTWRGSEDFATGVERYEMAYDKPVEPTRTTLTIHRSETERDVVVYTVSRTANFVGAKPRVTSITGDCSSCGLAPNSQLFYDDPVHPLLPTRIVDGRGTTTLSSYDTHGRLTSRTEATGTALSRTTTWTYDSAFPALPLRIEEPSTAGGSARRTTLMTYDAAGNPTNRRLQGVEAGSFFDLETVTTFAPSGQALTVNPPGFGNDDATSFTWDSARGGLMPLTRTEPLVGTTTFEHDVFNRQTAVTDPNGVRTETTYDSLNRVLTITQEGATSADDLTTAYEYNAFGDLTRTILPKGNLIEYGYDAAGRMTSIERKPDALTPGERTLYTLDQAGHRIKEELQSWQGTDWVTASWTEYRYQNRCQIGKIVHADGNVTEHAYDCDGNLEKVWDANHPRATNPIPTQFYQYDDLDRMTSVTQPWTGAGGAMAVTSYGYDVLDHMTAVTDAEGNTTTYEYSDRDLMTGQASPVSGSTTYAYNEHGEQVTEIDARGIVMTRSVDALGRVTGLAYPSPDFDVAYTYDDPAVPFSKGRLTRIARQGKAVDYRYDSFGRILVDGALAYGYDENGNPTSLTYPGGVEAVTTYDYADRPASLVAKRAGEPDQPLVTAASYLPSGPLMSLTLGNGLTETRNYSSRYHPTGISVPGRLNWSYSTDAVGNILAISEGFGSSRTYGYQDYQYFLTSGNGPWGTRSWTYDKIGNRLTETRGTVTDTYLYVPNAAGKNTPKIDQIFPNAGLPARYYHDSVGNLLDNGKLSFSYGEDRRLEHSGKPESGTTYTYDGRGFLNQAVLVFPAVSLTDPPLADQTLPTYNSAGLLHHRFSHRNLTPEASGGPTQDSDLYIFHFAGRPVATLDKVVDETSSGSTTTSTWQYLTTDHLGTPVLITNSSGAQVWQGGFEPFGADFSSTPTILRFPGQWADGAWGGGKDGGLYYNVHRWYEFARGRYTEPDPLGGVALDPRDLPWPSQGTERFSYFVYVQGNPIGFADALGLFKTKGCNAQQKAIINRSTKKFCKRLDGPDFSGCCKKTELQADLKKLCGDPNITIRCEAERTGSCKPKPGYLRCGWSLPYGRTVHICPDAWDSRCGPLGCTALHEMTHMLGHPLETLPDLVEKCLECG